MSIKCGHCKNHHETVAEVRACAGSLPIVHGGEEDRCTSKQFDFLNKLRLQHGLEPLAEDARNLTKRAASLAIQSYLEKNREDTPQHAGQLPSVAPSQVLSVSEHYSEIPAGFYATTSRTGNNDLDFWKVDRPTEGRWAGYVFVSRVIGGRPEQTMRKHEKTQALQAIRQAGPEKAAQKYGQEIGRCYRCNRHLTDETSRSLGIGPDCRSQKAA
jgi:hypothetical protein